MMARPRSSAVIVIGMHAASQSASRRAAAAIIALTIIRRVENPSSPDPANSDYIKSLKVLDK